MLGQSSKKDNTAETNLNYNSKSMPRVKSAKKTVPVHNNLKAAKFQAKKSAAETNLVSIDITFTSNSTSTKLWILEANSWEHKQAREWRKLQRQHQSWWQCYKWGPNEETGAALSPVTQGFRTWRQLQHQRHADAHQNSVPSLLNRESLQNRIKSCENCSMPGLLNLRKSLFCEHNVILNCMPVTISIIFVGLFAAGRQAVSRQQMQCLQIFSTNPPKTNNISLDWSAQTVWYAYFCTVVLCYQTFY